MLNIALPKGRLGDKVYALLAGAGYDCREAFDDSRKLVFEAEGSGVRYFLVKPSDVAIYVEHGAADIGIVGKDILLESGADVYELLDLGLGKCRMCVAGRNDYVEDTDRTLRVATKFVNVAKRYYNEIGPTDGQPSKIELQNKSWEPPGILSKAGCHVSIITDSPVTMQSQLRFCAAMAVKHGMDPFEAFKAITINPAEHIGIADRVGSLEVGKDADVVLMDGCLYELGTEVVATYIEGVKVEK